jgi:hypothetical protein
MMANFLSVISGPAGRPVVASEVPGEEEVIVG